MNFYEIIALYICTQTSFYRHSKAFFKIPFNNSAKILNSPHNKKQNKKLHRNWNVLDSSKNPKRK